jgi:hypothetical protein
MFGYDRKERIPCCSADIGEWVAEFEIIVFQAFYYLNEKITFSVFLKLFRIIPKLRPMEHLIGYFYKYFAKFVRQCAFFWVWGRIFPFNKLCLKLCGRTVKPVYIFCFLMLFYDIKPALFKALNLFFLKCLLNGFFIVFNR